MVDGVGEMPDDALPVGVGEELELGAEGVRDGQEFGAVLTEGGHLGQAQGELDALEEKGELVFKSKKMVG